MSPYIYYVQTNVDGLQIRVPSSTDGGYIDVVTAKCGQVDFNLCNPLKAATMREVRAVAKANGLRLRRPGTVAVRVAR